MLKVYAAQWCPHCIRTVEFLERNRIQFVYLDIETQPEDVVARVIEVNGGVDWVVPTLEYGGRWREGRRFDETQLAADLRELGLVFS